MTLYLTNPTLNLDVHDAMYAKKIGLLDTPNQGKTLNLKHVVWAADSGCFGGRFREQTWVSWLKKRAVHAETCLFATAPDIVGDGNGSIRRSAPWLPRLRRWGYQAALVAQNGMEKMGLPWDEFDWLFVGGTTEWKLAESTRDLIFEAQDRGKRIHIGRVNSAMRFMYCVNLGAESADGTGITSEPTRGLKDIMAWYEKAADPGWNPRPDWCRQ